MHANYTSASEQGLTTVVLICVFVASLLLAILTCAAGLWLGLKIVRGEPAAWPRLIAVATALTGLGTAVSIAQVAVMDATPKTQLGVSLLGFVVVAPGQCVIIARMLRLNRFRAIALWLATLLAPAVHVAVAFLLIRPFLMEAFVVPTNAMAPTLLGRHLVLECPVCGGDSYTSPLRPGMPVPPTDLAICEQFHVAPTSLEPPAPEGNQDRFLVAKYLSPRRWDLLVFRAPSNPSEHYVKRVVGLPGETVHIENGAVWINGVRQQPPPRLEGLEYITEFPHLPFSMKVNGSREEPAVLAADEYFVLGDFTHFSSDSRLWETGAPNHNVFAMPEDYVVGVVTHTYWPVSRWRMHR